ncbi:ferritin-like protein [uncultured Nostoc sp.]|uniref:ferritin-like domain-containing protein n=1 Tax=uncultured Nostoc sp. TaxID=340711 RepID=UPI0035CB0AEB
MTTVSDSLKLITTVDQLKYYLIQAMKIEHATIPPYMTALYSIKPGTNLEAFHIIRAVAVEEMLHLTLVANVYNAVGGTFDSGVLTTSDFVPRYPSYLPTGSTDFKVGLSKFSEETIKTFRQIERSQHVPESQALVASRSLEEYLLEVISFDPTKAFYSIGLFYAEIIRGLNALYKDNPNLFCGDFKRQITPEYYYNGGGDIIPVTDLRSAIRALKVIQDQGEGSRSETIYDAERELAHDYRFQQILLKQYYVIDKDDPTKSDLPDKPTGKHFTVDWDGVYPIQDNPKLSDYPEGSEVRTAALEFHSAYSDFLAKIQYAFDGHPEHLIPAVGGMFRLKEQANSLMRNPIPGKPGVNAAPLFRLD